MKRKIKIFDNLFTHAKYSTDFQPSNYIEWDRNIQPDKLCFYTDNSLHLILQYKKLFNKNYAWLLESPEITKSSYDWIKYNNYLFDKVFTHNKKLLDRGENFIFNPTGGCWIKKEDQKIYDKTKLISIISSAKRQTIGHRLRHEIISKYKNIDVFGRGYKPIDYKLEGLKDYMFQIVIENCKEDYYFTEKLIDCFRTGTVPIYWGCPSIGDFFNIKGIILIDNIEDLLNLELNENIYNDMLPYIKENFEKSEEFIISEDYMWEKLIKNNDKYSYRNIK